MNRDRTLRIINSSVALGAGLGFFSGMCINATSDRHYGYMDFSGLLPPVLAGFGAMAGAALGVSVAMLQEIVDYCKNRADNQNVIKPKLM